nr:hypothetical protein [Tanacetum cinerariifolium]
MLANKGIDLMKYMKINLGNGESMLLWDDPWHAGGILKDRYPRVYALETCKSVTIGGKLAHYSLSHSFRRSSRGGAEHTQFVEFTEMMQQVILAHMLDRWTWTRNNSGDFFVASVRMLIDDKVCTGGDQITNWIRYVPNKVNIFAWKIMSNSLATKFNISRRGIIIDSISCVNYDLRMETTNHLFFTCGMAQQVRRLINLWWDIPDMEIDSYASWKIWVSNIRLASKIKMLFEGVHYVMWWLLWWYRNRKIFEGKAPNKALFFDDVISKSFHWCRARTVLLAKVVRELHELHTMSALVDSRLESIEKFLNNISNQPNETDMNDLEFDDKSVDTPLVFPFPHSDDDLDDGEVLNELSEYENAGVLRLEIIINGFDGDDLAF